MTETGHIDWLNKRDTLGNLCLLLGHENQGKQDMSLEDWLASRDATFATRHLIPADRTLWRLDKFDEFLVAREALIRTRLKQLLASPTKQAVAVP